MKRTKTQKRPLRKTYIKEWRDFRGMSQETLATATDCHYSTVGRIERGELPYRQDFIEAVAEALGCTVADLTTRSPFDAEGIWTLWGELSPGQKRQLIEMGRVIKRTVPPDTPPSAQP